MVQAGGPAAINGFLYQILNHLAWFADIRIGSQIAGHGIQADAYVVLEPRDGGDARCEGPRTYVVEQYKVRPGRTWSVNSIIDDVLPDLRKAVLEPISPQGVYCFVTDGRGGRLDTFNEFLTSLKACQSQTDIDDLQEVAFGNGLPKTQRKLFEYIVKNTSAGKSERKRANEDLTVFKLLQNFQMRFEVAADDRSQDVERFLRPFVPNLGDERGVRVRLIGELMSKLALGEVRLDSPGIDELLRGAGLNPERLRKLAVLSATMVPLVADAVTRLKYKRAIDVREPPPWPEEKPVLVISGRSGNGKTWQLAKTVIKLGERNKVAVLIPAGGTTDETLARAVRLVWQDGLGETSERSPNALALHYKDMQPGAFRHWMTIGVDDVRSIDLVRDLIAQPWERWGMRLVMTVPHAVASSLKYEVPEHVHFCDVAPFSVNELDSLLQIHGQRWADLPLDLQKLLRAPILAGLYLSLGRSEFQHAPSSEYEIFEQFWQRMVARTCAGDAGILLALSGRVVDEKPYPLLRNQWSEVGLTDEGLARLDSVGWLHSNEAGEVGFAHDRLLNWASAKEVVRRYQVKVWSLEQLTAYLKRCAQPQWSNSVRRLDYLPIDAMWLLLDKPTELADLVTLLESFEQEQTYGSYASELYQHLLPTLGIRVAPLLLARLAKLEGMDQSDYLASLIADAMVALACQESVDLTRETASLVESSSEIQQKVGIALLSITPVVGLLDRLWDLHIESCKRLDDSRLNNSNFGRSHSAYEASHAALKVGVNQNPEWLRDRIITLNSDAVRVSELGYLLNSLDHPLASKIWNEAKGLLFANMPKDRQRSLIYCIGKFKDSAEVGFLVNSLGQQVDSMGGAALASLVKLDPYLALHHLGDDIDGNFVMYREWWLPDLMYARPNETRNRLLEIAQRTPDGHRFIEQLFQGRANELDEPLLDLLHRSFRDRLSRDLQITCKGDSGWTTFPLRLFNEISRPDLLALLVDKSSGELERMLGQLARSRIGCSGRSQDHVLEVVRAFLTLLPDSEITELVNAELQSSDYWVRHRGLKWAMIRPDATTLTLLGAIARAPVIFDTNGKPTSEWIQENYNAMRVLAAARADELLVDAIWTSGSPHFSVDLTDMRGVMVPMSKAITQRAADTLAGYQNAGNDERCCALITAWVSSDPDFIVPIQSILPQIAASSLAAVYACVALRQLGDESDEFAHFASQLLCSKERCHEGINALAGLGEKGILYLIQYLDTVPINGWGGLEVQSIRYLALHGQSHAFAVKRACQYCLSVRRSLEPLFDIAAEAADDQLRELMLEKAFDAASIYPFRTYCAIKGLAKFDSKRAIEAAFRHLQVSSHYERELCLLLTEVDPESAAKLLFDLAVEVKRDSLCAAVGRALRRLVSADVDIVLEAAFQNSDRRIRSVATELAGWLHADRLTAQLTSLYEAEIENEVRAAVFAAHTRRNNHAAVFELFDTFKVCPVEQRWALLLSILQLGDPVLLNDSKDQLWIGLVLDSVAYKYWHFAQQEIKTKIEKLK